MDLKKYKKKRIVPRGWKEITIGDVFRTSSGATPLSTEVSYYAMVLSLGLIVVNWTIRTFMIQQISYHKKDLKIRVRRYILLIQYLSQCMVLLLVKHQF